MKTEAQSPDVENRNPKKIRSAKSEAKAAMSEVNSGIRFRASFGPRISAFGLLLLLSTLIYQPLTSFGQGTAFTYQGRLDESSGPANGSYDLTFRLFDAVSGGSQGGPLTNTAVNVSDGYFTVTLDFGLNPFSSGANRWMEIAVRTNGGGAFGLLTPRQALTPAPYAIYSGNVSGAGISGTINSPSIANGAIGSSQVAEAAVTSSKLADGAVTAAKVATTTVSDWFYALKIANPTPVANDNFGVAIAAAGSNGVLVGAYLDDTGANNAGAAYLFSRANGALLSTFTNPTPTTSDHFGWSVAAVGAEHTLVGAYWDDTGASNAGAAYLFNTDGALLTTFTNPTPAPDAQFGYSVAGVGNDRVLIGANLDDTGATDAGVVYLFNTDGVLLTTFTNPTPAASENFGISLAAVGANRVLIGTPQDNTAGPAAGAAYLFDTAGVLLTTFTNPAPEAELLGYSVAAVGIDRVLIGAVANSAGAFGAGAAHLFSTNGTLLVTFTNPAPGSSDEFGNSVAAVGDDRVLIGAQFDDPGASDAGAAYLFSTDGLLLATLTNPAPVSGDVSGRSVAAVGTNQLLIGAVGSDSGAVNAGAAYLFRIETYAPGLIADGVRDGSITHADFDPTVGSWARSGNNVFRLDGSVGIGTASPGFNLHVNGTAGKPGGGSWSVASDGRLKKNIRPLAGTLDRLLTLHGVNFEYIDPTRLNELPGERIGLIAQEVEQVFPDWVETGADGYKRVTARGLEALVVEALRELQHKQDAKLAGLADELKRRDVENAALKARLEKLENLLSPQKGGLQ